MKIKLKDLLIGLFFAVAIILSLAVVQYLVLFLPLDWL